MLAVVSALCGLQAQLMSSAEVALWARVAGLDTDAVSRALWEERSLVKTWGMRGTLHLFASNEYALWQPALGSLPLFRPVWLRYFGVTAEQMETVGLLVAEALYGHILTREELSAEIGRATESDLLAERVLHGWGSILKPSARGGSLCFAPSLGQRVRFTHPAWWLGEQHAMEPDEALIEGSRRYIAAYGPSTRNDLARWWGIQPAHAGRLIQSLGERVAAVAVEGTQAWVLREDLPGLQDASITRQVSLVPAFDQYVLNASLHAAHLMPGDFKPRIYRPAAWVSPVLLVNGRMDGIWRYERKGKRLAVTIEPFVKLPAWARKAAEEEAGMLAEFLGASLALSWVN
jgi:hypothetical protein